MKEKTQKKKEHKLEIILDHVALLVESIENSLNKIKKYNFFIDKVNEFPNEGTKEVYISNKQSFGKLLLIEPISEGPYMTAIKKRGKGLHHIAINVKSIEDYVNKLLGSGWYLHLNSLNTLKSNTIWIARANTPILLEVSENKELFYNENYDLFIKEIKISFNNTRLLESLNIKEIRHSDTVKTLLNIENIKFKIEEII